MMNLVSPDQRHLRFWLPKPTAWEQASKVCLSFWCLLILQYVILWYCIYERVAHKLNEATYLRIVMLWLNQKFGSRERCQAKGLFSHWKLVVEADENSHQINLPGRSIGGFRDNNNQVSGKLVQNSYEPRRHSFLANSDWESNFENLGDRDSRRHLSITTTKKLKPISQLLTWATTPEY